MGETGKKKKKRNDISKALTIVPGICKVVSNCQLIFFILK